MKYLFIFLFIYWDCFHSLQAQVCISNINTAPCCNNDSLQQGEGFIRTDPPFAFNPEESLGKWKNKFNWRMDSLKIYAPNGNWGSQTPPIPFFVENPFITRTNAALRHINYYDFSTIPQIPENLDYYPEDGWELIHRHLGYRPNETSFADLSEDRDNPYFILYNRYTGRLRVLSALNQSDQPDKISTSVFFKSYFGQPYIVSGLFGNYGGFSQPLDQQTKITSVSQGSGGVSGRNFFAADFDTSYDPCICNASSDLEIAFTKLNTASIHLEGRIIGTNIPLNTSGNSPLLNRNDFLTAVHREGFTVNGGLQTYHNIDELVKKYYVPEMTLAEKLFVSGLKAIINGVGSAIDKNLLDKVASAMLTKELGGEKIFGFQLDSTLKFEPGIVGALTKTLTSEIFPDRSKIPNISFLEAEGVFTGSYNDETLINTDRIILKHPGSKNSSASSVPWMEYPFYNEALGIFAVLETPKVANWYYEEPVFGYTLTYNRFAFQNQLRYTFNPAAEVDTSETKIYGALVIESSNFNDPTGGDIFVRNLGKIKDTTINDNAIKTYITPIVPIGCLHKIVPYIQSAGLNSHPSIDKVSLRLLIEYTFKQNIYGKTKKTFQILTYPVQFIDSSDPDYIGDFELYEDLSIYPRSLTIGDVTFNKDTIVFAWDTLIVQGSVNAAIGKKVKLISNGIILVKPNSFLGSGVSTSKGLPFDCNTKILSVSDQFVKSFCNGSKYKANIPVAIAQKSTQKENKAAVQEEYVIKETTTNSLSAYPNPATGQTTIRYSLAEKGRVSIYLSNMLGEKLVVLVKGEQREAGVYEVSLDSSRLPAGLYFYTLETETTRITKRLMKAP